MNIKKNMIVRVSKCVVCIRMTEIYWQYAPLFLLIISVGWDYVSELQPPTSLLFIPKMIWVWRATAEWYWHGKTTHLGEKPVSVPLCPAHIQHALTRARTRVSAVRGRRLNAWAIVRPYINTTNILYVQQTNKYGNECVPLFHYFGQD
jgi:hypothetical protein